MRKIAVKAGLVAGPDDGRLSFVTEAEAATHYIIECGMLSNFKQAYISSAMFYEGWITDVSKASRTPIPQSDDHFVLADCGGGTTDITAYKIVETDPLAIEEITVSDCA